MGWHWEPLPRNLGPTHDWRPIALYRGDVLAVVALVGPEVAPWHAALLDDVCLALSEPWRCDLPAEPELIERD